MQHERPDDQADERTDDTPPAEAGPEPSGASPTGGSASESSTSAPSSSPARDELLREVGEAATRVGGLLGRVTRRTLAAGEQLAHDAKPEVERLAKRARPEAERLAKRARAAAEAVKPHLERAGREATQYVKDHDAEIKHAAVTGASIASRRIVPPTYRPVIDALGLSHVRPPLRQPPLQQPPLADEAATEQDDDGSPPATPDR